jgi:hypothetical protein
MEDVVGRVLKASTREELPVPIICVECIRFLARLPGWNVWNMPRSALE